MRSNKNWIFFSKLHYLERSIPLIKWCAYPSFIRGFPYSNCGPWTRSSSLTWEHVRNVDTQTPPQTYWISIPILTIFPEESYEKLCSRDLNWKPSLQNKFPLKEKKILNRSGRRIWDTVEQPTLMVGTSVGEKRGLPVMGAPGPTSCPSTLGCHVRRAAQSLNDSWAAPVSLTIVSVVPLELYSSTTPTQLYPGDLI